MPVKVTGVAQTVARMRQVADRATDAARKQMERQAKRIAEIAQEMVPSRSQSA
jgi:hypothetical protein